MSCGRDVRGLTASLSAAALDGNAVALALQALGSNQTLDLGGLGLLGLALLGDSAADDELADIILLVEAEEAADLGGTLGAETLGDDGVGQAGEFTLTLLDDGESEDGKVQTGDGTTDGLALALTGAAGAVAAVALSEEETGTGGKENCGRLMSMMRVGGFCGFSWRVVCRGVVQNVPPCFMGKPVMRNLVSYLFYW